MLADLYSLINDRVGEGEFLMMCIEKAKQCEQHGIDIQALENRLRKLQSAGKMERLAFMITSPPFYLVYVCI